jgi:hypothetical protein
LTWVAANGDALCPVIITSRKVPGDINQGGHRPGKDFIIDSNAKPYVGRAIFGRFIRHQLISHITALRIIQCDSKAEAVLLMGDCSAHVTPEVFRLVGESHMAILTFVPHTINIFQASGNRLGTLVHQGYFGAFPSCDDHVDQLFLGLRPQFLDTPL